MARKSSRGKVLVRIGPAVWEFSRADLKRYGGDAYALKMLGKSGRTAFVSYADEWFRWTGRPDYSAATEATPDEMAEIRAAVVLHEPQPTRRPW